MPSRLTRDRPDLWQRGLDLATGLTGYRYLPKLPAADGTIFACGGTGSYETPLQRIDRLIAYWEYVRRESATPRDREEAEDHLQRLRSERKGFALSPSSVLVPEGAMEWLLHEVGHWIAASPEERQLSNYGDGHEVEAWAFEELVLGHCGPARLFAPVTQREGTAFDLSGPLPSWAFRHIARQMAVDRVAVEPFHQLWTEWVRWGTQQGDRAPWRTES